MEKTERETVTYFEPTPPMSTYLVAFVVSDFDCVGTDMKLLDGRKIPLNVCSRPVYAHKGKFALNVAVRVMDYYLTTFNTDYPLPKLGNIS